MKTIIITGAASGLGKSISEEFDKKKCNLVLCDRNLIDIKKYKNQVLFFKIDLTDEKQIKKLFDETLKKFKKIDIVINNAGITDKKHFSWCRTQPCPYIALCLRRSTPACELQTYR